MGLCPKKILINQKKKRRRKKCIKKANKSMLIRGIYHILYE